MSQSISLAPYTIRIRKKGDKKFLALDKLAAKNQKTLDVIDVLDAYFKARTKKACVEDDGTRSFQTTTHVVEKNNPRKITGLMEYGEFGYAAKLKNLQTGVAKHREVNDCEYIPLYFSVWHLANQNEAILILQRFGALGVKSVFQNDLRQFLNRYFEDVMLDILPVIMEDKLNGILSGQIKKIRFIKNSVPADIAKDMGLLVNAEEPDSRMEVVVRAPKNNFLSRPKWLRDFQNGVTLKLIEIQEVVYDDIKLEISDKGKIKTVGLRKLDHLKLDFDVTDQIEIDETSGHPTFESIDGLAQGISNEIATQLDWPTV